MKDNNKIKLNIVITVLLIVLPILTSIICLGFGRLNIPLSDIIDFFRGKEIAKMHALTLANVSA